MLLVSFHGPKGSCRRRKLRPASNRALYTQLFTIVLFTSRRATFLALGMNLGHAHFCHAHFRHAASRRQETKKTRARGAADPDSDFCLGASRRHRRRDPLAYWRTRCKEGGRKRAKGDGDGVTVTAMMTVKAPQSHAGRCHHIPRPYAVTVCRDRMP